MGRCYNGHTQDFWRTEIPKSLFPNVVLCNKRPGEYLLSDISIKWLAKKQKIKDPVAGICKIVTDKIIAPAGRVQEMPCEKYGTYSFLLRTDIKDKYLGVLIDNEISWEYFGDTGGIDNLTHFLNNHENVIHAKKKGNRVTVTVCKSFCGLTISEIDVSGSDVSSIKMRCNTVQCCCANNYAMDLCMPEVEGCFDLVVVDKNDVVLFTIGRAIVNNSNTHNTMAYWYEGDLLHKERLPVFLERATPIEETSERTLSNFDKKRERTTIKEQYSFVSKELSYNGVNALRDIFLKERLLMDTEAGIREVYNDQWNSGLIDASRGAPTGTLLVQGETKSTSIDCDAKCWGKSSTLSVINRHNVIVWKSDTDTGVVESIDGFSYIENGHYDFEVKNIDTITIKVGIFVNGMLKSEKDIKPNCLVRLCALACKCDKIEIKTAVVIC